MKKVELHSVGTTVPSHAEPSNLSSVPGPLGGRKTSGLPWNRGLSPTLDCRSAKPLKPKQGTVLSDCWEEILKMVLNAHIKWGISWSKSSLSQEDMIPVWCHDPPSTKVKESFTSFPSSLSNLVWSKQGWTKPCMGTQPCQGFAFLLLIATGLAGFLPSGSHSQEAVHSCWSLVTPYPGDGSISMVKQQIPRLWLTTSKFDRNCVIISKRVNSIQLQWSSNG